jgi:two-component system nitrogen regulation response regulator GlnG
MSNPAILIVDDESAIQHAFRRAFREDALTLIGVGSATEALAHVQQKRPDVIILDVHLPDATGLETFHRLQELDARIPVIMITGHGTTELAIEAIREGAYEYLLKPLDLTELRTMIGRALRSSQLMRVPAVLPEEQPTTSGDLFLGRCTAMQEVYKAIGRVARQNVTVLILGESGTGKELVARAIYQHSHRADKPFLAVNCAAIPETLLESELFGHERGAFTGADRQRIGKFEQCHGGTLFLDEVGDMTPATQAKILRVLQDQHFERIGSEATISTDVRLIAATNADLPRLVEDGRFRRDLYFRLNVFQIDLPPLRDRGDDLHLLIHHYLGLFGQELGKPVREVSPETMTALLAYRWPGNVRELQSVLKQALLQMPGSVLLPEWLPAVVRGNGTATEDSGAAAGDLVDWNQFIAERLAANTEELYAEALERFERELLMRVLRHTSGNQLQAARILGITRGSLRTKIRALGISIARSVLSDNEPGDS